MLKLSMPTACVRQGKIFVHAQDLVLYLVWDSESESSKDMTIVGATMEAQDESSSEQATKAKEKDSQKKKDKKRRRSTSSRSSTSEETDASKDWFHFEQLH